MGLGSQSASRFPRPVVAPVVVASGRAVGCDGVLVERFLSSRLVGRHLSAAGHWLGINLEGPLAMEIEEADGCRPMNLGNGCLVILPAGAAFNLRHGPSEWGVVEVSLEKIRRVLGTDLRVLPTYGVYDAPLTAVVLGLLHEAATGGAAGRPYRDALALALVARLAGLFELVAPAADAFTGDRLAVTCALVDEHLAERITVKSLASGSGLSLAHFSREFKRGTGETPHAFIMRRRLERAHMLLADGESIVDAAASSGFADQSHLSRLFKRRYLVTPGAFARTRPQTIDDK
jgi:AraC-like DNA-binding protein